MLKIPLLMTSIVLTAACTVNLVDKEIVDHSYVTTGNPKNIHLALESRIDYGVVTIRPRISGKYQRLSVVTVRETYQDKYIPGDEIAGFALATAILAGLPLLFIDKDLTWFECGVAAECQDRGSKQIIEKEKSGRIDQLVNFIPDEVELSIVANNGVRLRVPLNDEGLATTSLRELGYPTKFTVKLAYDGQHESIKVDSPASYLANIDVGAIMLSSISPGSGPEKTSRYADPFKEISSLVNDNMQRYIHSVSKPYIPKAPTLPTIAEPDFPPAPTLVKSHFETKAEFQKRVRAAIDDRDRAIDLMTKTYRKQVKTRNTKLRPLLAEYNKTLSSLNDQYHMRQAKLERSLEDEQQLQLLLAVQHVLGEPRLENLQYDAEGQMVHANLSMSNTDYHQPILWKMPPKKAQTLFLNPRSAGIDSKITLRQAGYRGSHDLRLDKVSINYQDRNYEPVMEPNQYLSRDFRVVLRDALLPVEEELQLIGTQETSALAEMAIQNAELVDQLQLSAESYVKQQEIVVGKTVFNDDIPTLLSNTKPKKINKHRRLIVIGIENYLFTDQVAFSRRSAELFVQVAQKKLGISEKNTLSLIDYQATSGALKDSLRLFLDDIDTQDEVIFYYSGHGIPDPAEQNEPYILPIDKAPGFVSEDKAFRLAYIYKQLSDSSAKKIVAIIDSCFSGATDGKSVLGGVAAARLMPKAIDFDRDKMVVLTASKGNQFSNMFEEKGNRLFSYYVMKSLLKGRTDISTLYQEVSVQVKDASGKMGLLYKQEPEIRGNTLLKIE